MRFAIGAALLAALCIPSLAQDKKSADGHTAPDARKCKKCSVAYEKALDRTRQNLVKEFFPVRMIAGWLLLADGRFEDDLKMVVETARRWEEFLSYGDHAKNWFPALAGFFLSEVQKHKPSTEVLEALKKIADHFVKTQERTGGWFKWFEGAYNERKDYPVKDLGILDAMVFGLLHSMKAHGVDVPDATLQKAEKCLLALLGGEGIAYGTGQNGGDPTGARGGFCIYALAHAGRTDHRIYKTYTQHLPRAIPKLDQGHHVGAIHCLGVTLGCRTLGAPVYAKLSKEWIDKLIAKQEADGTLYVGDDGDAGGEIGLLKSKVGSTAAFALLLLMQDATVLAPPKKKK